MNISNPIYGTKKYLEIIKEELKEEEKVYRDLLMERGNSEVNKSADYKTGTFLDEAIAASVARQKALKDMIVRFVEIKKEHSTDGRIGLDDIVDIYVFEKEDDPIMKVQITGERPMVLENEGLAKITLQSPMGKAIFGKKVDDIVSFAIQTKKSGKLDEKTRTVRILSVEHSLSKENVEQKQHGEE